MSESQSGYIALGRAQDTGFKYVLKWLSGTVEVLVVKEHDLREQNRLFVALSCPAPAADVQHGDGGQLCEAACAGAHRHGDKRIIAAAGSDRVELIFPTLETLLKIVQDIRHDFFFFRPYQHPDPDDGILLGHHFV